MSAVQVEQKSYEMRDGLGHFQENRIRFQKGE